MKTFKEYLAEGKKSYSFKIKVAGELPEDFQSNLKTSLEIKSPLSIKKLSLAPLELAIIPEKRESPGPISRKTKGSLGNARFSGKCFLKTFRA